MAYLSTFEVNGQYMKATTGKYYYRSTRVFTLGRIDRHRWLGYIAHLVPRLPGHQVVIYLPYIFRPWHRLGIRRRSWPNRNLCVPGRRMPYTRLRLNSNHHGNSTKQHHQKFFHDLTTIDTTSKFGVRSCAAISLLFRRSNYTTDGPLPSPK